MDASRRSHAPLTSWKTPHAMGSEDMRAANGIRPACKRALCDEWQKGGKFTVWQFFFHPARALRGWAARTV